MDTVRAFLSQLNIPQTKPDWKRFLRRSHKPILYLFGIFIIFLLLTPIFTYVYFANDLASKEAIMNSNNSGVLLYDRKGELFFSLYQAKKRTFIPMSDIPQITQDAVIAAEDKDFYKHPGFSIPSIIRSAILDVQTNQLAYGGSTITQQLVKNALLTSRKNFLRKYQEIVLAAEIERRYSKKEILEMYLNSVYFGEGAIGIDDAARAYFGKTPKQLTIAESALLIAILPAPSAFSPLTGDKEEAFRRQKIVLAKLEQQGYISKEEQQQAATQEIIFNPTKEDPISLAAPHFALMVKEELLKMYSEEQLTRSGFEVKTTLDLEWQKFAETTVKNQIQYLRFNKASNAGVVVEDPKTGEIKALVGSYDWDDEAFGKLNITKAARQPGSSFKPIIYAKAFADETITPGTILEDKEITFPGNFKPKNYDGRFRGPVLPRRALATSLNIPAVEVMEQVGVANGVAFAKTLGITTLKGPSSYGLSLVLGSAEVPLLELTNVYAVFANEGKKPTQTTILEVKDKRNTVLYTHAPTTTSVLDPRVAFLISSILSDTRARSESFGNALSISRPAAVKTGTTNDYRDALTVGYTPSLVIGVWVGNNDNTPMDNIAGSLGAAPIWRRLMEQFLKDTTVERFAPPSGLSLVRICRQNGYKSNVATSSAYFEYFLQGTDPTADCNDRPTPTGEPTPTLFPSETPAPTDTPSPTSQPTPTPTTEQVPPTSPPTPTPTLGVAPTIAQHRGA